MAYKYSKIDSIIDLLTAARDHAAKQNYPENSLYKFLSYWLEYDGKVFLFEREKRKKKSFDVARRLGRWVANEKSWGIHRDSNDNISVEFNADDF